jgi:rare lipoprotein A
MNKLWMTGAVFFTTTLIFTACSTRGSGVYRSYNYTPAKIYSDDASNYSKRPPKKRYSHATMRPYVVRGVKYYPTVVNAGEVFHGRASWYGPNFHGKLTSNGERYNMWAMTAAHKTLPMNTIVKVTNLKNGKSTVVRINDRGPFVSNRIIDLSKAAASKIDMIGSGTAPVKLEILGFEGKGNHNVPKTKKEIAKLSKKQVQTGANFALQIGSFSRISGALLTQEKYDNTDGYKTIIKDVQGSGGSRMFKVWLTGFQSEKEARDYKANGPFSGAFIVRED